MNRTLILSFFIACISFQAIAQTGSITNISVQQRTDGSGLLDVYFDLSGEANSYHIFLDASFDNGLTYLPLDPAFLQGDTGPLPSGIQYHIVWDGYASFPDTYSDEAKLKVLAIETFGIGIPCPGMPFFTDDRDGKIYNTVLIGDQCWMKENLNFYVINSFCYDDDDAMCDAYGRLYPWFTAMDGEESSNAVPSGVQGVCPAGWHLPSDAEWQIMVDYVVAQGYPNYADNPNGAGNALKSCRQINSPLGGACDTDEHPRWEDGYDPYHNFTHFGTDEFGYSALPGGVRDTDGSFFGLGYRGQWWSSTEVTTTHAWYRLLGNVFGNVYRYEHVKGRGFSVRCVRDN
ncbi:MAG: hypothetical protein EA393_07070 [Bacteroidetes bacterium]|nr:MAG: hypothetical protein EA393_07070 [Bacteroidota bacterium]